MQTDGKAAGVLVLFLVPWGNDQVGSLEGLQNKLGERHDIKPGDGERADSLPRLTVICAPAEKQCIHAT
jgi:hypothetical protein